MPDAARLRGLSESDLLFFQKLIDAADPAGRARRRIDYRSTDALLKLARHNLIKARCYQGDSWVYILISEEWRGIALKTVTARYGAGRQVLKREEVPQGVDNVVDITRRTA